MDSNLIIVILLCSTIQFTKTFNLSPQPNIVFRQPLRIGSADLRSSYFGFTLNLRSGGSVIVGAPRATSSVPAQTGINETGAVYKCSLTTTVCDEFVFDGQGNVYSENDDVTYEDQQKDYQWLGASIDGNTEDGNPFVVCAPRMTSRIKEDQWSIESIVNGICYWTPDTNGTQPTKIRRIAPLRLKSREDYRYGQQGLSVHITADNSETLIGAPGIDSWKGSVIRFRTRKQDTIGGQARRDTQSVHLAKKRAAPVSYVSEVAAPLSLSNDSYFGYAVASGNFLASQPEKILYVASAPQANNQNGQVFIFDILDQVDNRDNVMKILHQFESQQMGEYFGYALVADRFSGSEFMDLAVAAPMYKRTLDGFDNGAVYFYRNLEGKSFELAAVLQAPERRDGGRFGTTLTKIGDINGDGFNDLAIGAPYEENCGAVYIYLGSANGLGVTPDQKLVGSTGGDVAQMFGHGVSKGADVDGNHYVDVAIGAPGIDSVYLFKAYPVVSVVASIRSESEVKLSDTTMKLSACWNLVSPHSLKDKVNMSILIRLDPQHGRVLLPDGNNTMDFNDMAGEVETCVTIDTNIRMTEANIDKTVDLEFNYKILDGVPDSAEFCEHCVAVNPSDDTMVRNKVAISTGCATDRCVADLRIKSFIRFSKPYILGSARSLTIDYEVNNAGETAYLTQLNITIQRPVTFLRIPPNCRQLDEQMLCDVIGKPFYNGEVAKFQLSLDVTKVTAHFQVTAYAFSSFDELNDADNVVNDIIEVTEFSDVEISGRSSVASIILEDGLHSQNVIHAFEIRNNGPSRIMNLDVIVSIPVALRDPWTLQRLDVVDVQSISARCVYENVHYDPEWTANGTVLIRNAIEISSMPIPLPDDLMLAVPIFPPDDDGEIQQERRRRDISFQTYNQYTERLTEFEGVSPLRNTDRVDVILNDLPVKRTQILECTDENSGEFCIQGRFSVHNFQMGNTPIVISLNLTIDLAKLDKVITEDKDKFVFKTSAEVKRLNDKFGTSVKTVQTRPYTIISKYHDRGTPIWVWIVSGLGGLLLLVLLTFGMYKLGFFKRSTKEEMEKLQRDGTPMVPLTSQPSNENIDSST